MRLFFALVLLALVGCSEDDCNPVDQAGDVDPPTAIRDLSATTGQHASVVLAWTAPGDNGLDGAASEYDLRYSGNAIDDDTWLQATKIESMPEPAVAGTKEEFTLGGPWNEGDWFFAIRTIDDAGNMSSLSNVPLLTIEWCFSSVSSTEVDFVFSNLDGSMECLQSWTYLDQLADDFVFVASPGVQAQFPAVFPDETAWGYEEEKAFVGLLFTEADSIQSDLKMTEIDRSGTQIVVVEAEYRVRVVTGGSAITYTGVAFYTLRQEATTWFLTRWEDTASSNPIGLLRGGLAQ